MCIRDRCGVAGSLRSGKCRVGVVQRRARLLLRRQSRVVGALIRRNGIGPVSYTHLDVYKRQIWNLPLKHPVNLAYEAATADLADVNICL